MKLTHAKPLCLGRMGALESCSAGLFCKFFAIRQLQTILFRSELFFWYGIWKSYKTSTVCFSEWWPPTKCKLIFDISSKPVNWDILIGCWGISTNQKVDIWATMESKTEGTMRKSIENWCQKIVYILLGVIILKNKQWQQCNHLASTQQCYQQTQCCWWTYHYNEWHSSEEISSPCK